MSAISPFIRVLRAEADALEEASEGANPANTQAIRVVVKAKRAAADKLEAEEREITERISGR